MKATIIAECAGWFGGCKQFLTTIDLPHAPVKGQFLKFDDRKYKIKDVIYSCTSEYPKDRFSSLLITVEKVR